MTQQILLVYEQIPESTTILLLQAADLNAAGLKMADVVSIHGTYQNTTEVTEAQDRIHNTMSEAISTLWKDKIIFGATPEKTSEGEDASPPQIDAARTIVIHTGFVL